MLSAKLIRWCGLATVVSGIFFAMYFVLHIGGDPPTAVDARNNLYPVESTLGVAAIRAGVPSRWAGGLIIVGAIILDLPPQPVGPTPWPVTVAGAVILGIGLVGFGYPVWAAGDTVARQPVMRTSRPETLA